MTTAKAAPESESAWHGLSAVGCGRLLQSPFRGNVVRHEARNHQVCLLTIPGRPFHSGDPQVFPRGIDKCSAGVLSEALEAYGRYLHEDKVVCRRG